MTLTSTQTPSLEKPLPITIHVDAEHSGIRAVGCGVLFATFVSITGIIALIFPDSILIGAFIALVVSAILTNFVDKSLKGKWASGRIVTIDENEIAIQNKGTSEFTLNPQKQLNPLSWYFVVKRSGRVKKGWHVIGFALEQDDVYIPVYTFCSPTDFENIPFYKQFTKLEKQTKQDENMKLAGIQRRLHLAENCRGLFGAEMTLSQFTNYLETLEKHFPTWMPKS